MTNYYKQTLKTFRKIGIKIKGFLYHIYVVILSNGTKIRNFDPILLNVAKFRDNIAKNQGIQAQMSKICHISCQKCVNVVTKNGLIKKKNTQN